MSDRRQGGSLRSQSSTIANVLAASAIGVLQLGVAISLAALIFSGPLSAGAGRAASGFILGTAVVSLIVGSRTSMSVVISGAQDTAAIVVAAVAASIVAAPGVSVDQQIPTVIVMIAVATVATGVVFWLLGRYGLTAFVRFLPSPVISGFTAGTGWLLLRGGIEVMHGEELHIADLPGLLGWDEFRFLLPGLALAAVMLVVVSTRITNTAVSVAILGGTIIFHLVGRSMTSLQSIEDQGWLVGPFVEGSSWAPIGPSDLQAANWSAIFNNTLPIVAVVAVAVVGMLLNLSGLEGGPDTQIDMNQEAGSVGAANVLVGVGGGLVGYHLIGDTVLARQLGARGRRISFMIAGIALVVFFIGNDLIALVPRSIAGGVLSGLGLNLLLDWVRKSLAKMNAMDRVLSSLILAIIALLGVLEGVSVGVLVAAAVFVFKYSRIDPVRHIIDAAGRSNVDRPDSVHNELIAASGSILAFELQGYLFFGSTTRLRADIDAHVASGETVCHFVVVDFGRVTGIDSTASQGLVAITRQLADQDVTVVYSAVSNAITSDLGTDHGLSDVTTHQDLDHAVAWCEDQLLANILEIDTSSAANVVRKGSPSVLDSFDPKIEQFMTRRTLDPDQVLITEGATDRDLYFIESGKMTAWIETDDGRRVRIRQVLAGAALGEIAFCAGSPRTATVTADTPAVVWVLTRDRFDELVLADPQTAIEFQDELLRRMSQRVSSTSSMVRDLLR